MKTQKLWEMTYKADHRNHKHRCLACNKVIQPGMEVLMWRVHHGTKAVHLECAEAPHPCGTYRDAIHAWCK
jgi:hypothetical protein